MATDVMREDAKAAQSVYVPIAEIAATLDLSEARVYGLIAEGVVPALRVGRRIRVPRRTFEQWLRDQEQRALANLREPMAFDRDVTELASVLAGASPIAPHERAALDSVSETKGGQSAN